MSTDVEDRVRRVEARLGRLTLAVVLGLATAACGSSSDSESQPQRSPQSASAPVATLGSMPAGDGPIEPGTYRIPSSAWSVTDFTVTFPEGWTVQYGHVYRANPDQDDEYGFYAVTVDSIYVEACEGSNSGLMVVGPTIEDLATALLQQRGPTASGPVATTLGGHPATRIDLTVPEGFDLGTCNVKDVGLQIWYSAPADKYFVLLADAVASVYILDVNGQRQVFMTQHGRATSEQDLAELQAVLDSISIES